MSELRIEQRIAERQDALSPQERRAAATLVDHLDDLATYRAAELADLAGVSKATMSRLFRSLGYADFDEVRAHLRALREAGEPRRLDGPPDLGAHAEAEGELVRRALAQPRLDDAVALVADAARVTVLGWRSGYPVALHLRQQLAHARGDVRLAPAPGQVLGEEIADLTAGDVAVVLGFRRRPAGFGALLAAVHDTGATVLLVADRTASMHAHHADLWLECPVETRLAFDSYAGAMSLVGVLADGVLSHLGAPARRRAAAISATYARLGEVE
ncbi:MurR/RpiR family transcriptional regulator [Nocardioides sp. C4-1]|uniref:MurR/RpiR family transcriptional regulator n=1 Tax=Nocardioides sp. C4-1 TaxID=3151851 RepID=UPI003264D4CE